MPSNESIINIFISGTGAIGVEGQHTVGDYGTKAFSDAPLSISMGAATANPIATSGTPINFETVISGTNVISKPKYGGITHVSVDAAGTGYPDQFTVTVTGGSGTGFSATGYASGGAITGIHVPLANRGTGYLASDTLTVVLGGGGSGGAATAHINANIVPVTVTVQNALPLNIAVGMPVGVKGLVETESHDGAAISGAHIITAFDTTNRRISFDLTMPFIKAPSNTTPVDATSVTAGSVYFPPAWLEVYGGYSGLNLEGYFNVGRGAELITQNVHAVWNAGSPTQAHKNSQKFISLAMTAGRYHNYGGPTIIAGFPGGALRLVQVAGSRAVSGRSES